MAQLKSTNVMGNLSVTGNVVASQIIKNDGTNDKILMGDGSTKFWSDLVKKPNGGSTTSAIATYDDPTGEKLRNTSVTITPGTSDIYTPGRILSGMNNTTDTIKDMNQFAADLFVSGNGSAPNSPKVAGFYLGKSQSDENRHMDIVSGGGVSYIDFNSATNQKDYMDRLYVNVADGSVLWQWDSGATNKTFTFEGGKIIANQIQYSLANNIFSTDKYSYSRIAIIDNDGNIKHRSRDEFIKDLNLSVIFNLKGTVNAKAELKTIVANVGDVYVITTSPTSSYVCIKSSAGSLTTDTEINNHWAEIGLTVDLQGYSPIGSLAVIHSTGKPGTYEPYGTRYYPVYVDKLNEVTTTGSTSYNTNYTNSLARANPDFYYFDSGTWSSLNVGQKDHCGILTLHYGTAADDKYADITPLKAFTSNRTFTLPDTGGSFVTVPNQMTKAYVPKFNADGYTITNSHITDDDTKITLSLPAAISGTDYQDNADDPSQKYMLKILSNQTSSYSDQKWLGRLITGTSTLAIVAGIYKGMATIGAHSWTGAANWADLYFNPDGSAKLYLGGSGSRKNNGVVKIENSIGGAYLNTGNLLETKSGDTITSGASWKHLAAIDAYTQNYIPKFSGTGGYLITASAISDDEEEGIITLGRNSTINGSLSMNGNGPIKFPNGERITDRSNHYISAGRGFTDGSGLYGLKIVACEQKDCQSGLGQDVFKTHSDTYWKEQYAGTFIEPLFCYSKDYDFCIVGSTTPDLTPWNGEGYISFAMHDAEHNPNIYRRIAQFDKDGNFWSAGKMQQDYENQVVDRGTNAGTQYCIPRFGAVNYRIEDSHIKDNNTNIILGLNTVITDSSLEFTNSNANIKIATISADVDYGVIQFYSKTGTNVETQRNLFIDLGTQHSLVVGAPTGTSNNDYKVHIQHPMGINNNITLYSPSGNSPSLQLKSNTAFANFTYNSTDKCIDVTFS